MNQPDRILTELEPPPGGLQRLRARRDAARRLQPSWWALAAGGATAAAAWLAIGPPQPQLQMPMAGARLIGERSHGVEVTILENGRAVALPSADPNVRIYRVEPVPAAKGR
jgi:hypothetical protein